MDFLPQMGTEYLDQTDLERGYLAVHEDASQVKLHLETNVHLKNHQFYSEYETTLRKEFKKHFKIKHYRREQEIN